jgi:hypothetical protein
MTLFMSELLLPDVWAEPTLKVIDQVGLHIDPNSPPWSREPRAA